MQLSNWPLWEPKSNAPGTEDPAAIWPLTGPDGNLADCVGPVCNTAADLSSPPRALDDPSFHFPAGIWEQNGPFGPQTL